MISSIPRRLGQYGRRYARHEVALLLLVVTYIYANYQILVQLPETVLETVIIAVTPVYLTVEGILVGLAPQIKGRLWRNSVVGIGIVTMLFEIRTFLIASFQSLQLRYLSTTETTTLFQQESFLFLLFVEFYFVAIILMDLPTRNSRK